MKKIYLSLFIILLITVLSVSLVGCNENKTDTDLEYEVRDDGNIAITSYTDNSSTTAIAIPDTIDGKPVVEVRNFALFNTESIKQITIGKNVQEIGDWAFTNNKLVSEYVVDSENEYFTAVDGVLYTKDMKTLLSYPIAKNIGFDKFNQALTTATFIVPEGVENLANRSFYHAGHLTEVSLPSTLKTIGTMCFDRCTKMERINLPEGLTDIGKDAFIYCTGLTEITIPSTVTQIGEYAFSYCENIKTVTMLCKKEQVTFGNEKWYPTQDGQNIKGLKIEWK